MVALLLEENLTLRPSINNHVLVHLTLTMDIEYIPLMDGQGGSHSVGLYEIGLIL